MYYELLLIHCVFECVSAADIVPTTGLLLLSAIFHTWLWILHPWCLGKEHRPKTSILKTIQWWCIAPRKVLPRNSLSRSLPSFWEWDVLQGAHLVFSSPLVSCLVPVTWMSITATFYLTGWPTFKDLSLLLLFSCTYVLQMQGGVEKTVFFFFFFWPRSCEDASPSFASSARWLWMSSDT